MSAIIAQALTDALLTLGIIIGAVAVPYMAIDLVRMAYSDVHPQD